jgi:hypothetical protein
MRSITQVPQRMVHNFVEKKIGETYWHYHSLESSWGALSDGAISFQIRLSHFRWELIFWIFDVSSATEQDFFTFYVTFCFTESDRRILVLSVTKTSTDSTGSALANREIKMT